MKKSMFFKSIVVGLVMAMVMTVTAFADTNLNVTNAGQFEIPDENVVVITTPDGEKIYAERDSIQLNMQQSNARAVDRNGAYILSNAFLAGVITDVENKLDIYSFNGCEETYTTYSQFRVMTASKSLQDQVQAAFAANGMTLGAWVVVSEVEIISNNPRTLTYRIPGSTSSTTISVDEGVYTFRYSIPLGQKNGITQGTLSFINANNQSGTALFNFGVSFDQE